MAGRHLQAVRQAGDAWDERWLRVADAWAELERAVTAMPIEPDGFALVDGRPMLAFHSHGVLVRHEDDPSRLAWVPRMWLPCTALGPRGGKCRREVSIAEARSHHFHKLTLVEVRDATWKRMFRQVCDQHEDVPPERCRLGDARLVLALDQ